MVMRERTGLKSTASIVWELKMDKGYVLWSLRDCLVDEDTKIDVELIQRFRQFGVTRVQVELDA